MWNISIKIVYILVNHIVVIKAVINHLMKYIKISLNLLLKKYENYVYVQYILHKYYIGLYKISKYSKL